MIKLDESELFHYFSEAERSVVGDVETLILREKKFNVHCCTSRFGERAENFLLIRMLTEAHVLPLPQKDEEIKDLRSYYQYLPRRGVLYLSRGGRLLNFDEKLLRRLWPKFFSSNSLQIILKKRYKNDLQALAEFHNASSLVEMIAHKFYGRITAYTTDCVLQHLLACATSFHFPKIFERLPPLYLATNTGKI